MNWKTLKDISKKQLEKRGFSGTVMESASPAAKEFADKVSNDVIGPGKLLMLCMESGVVADYPAICANTLQKQLSDEFFAYDPPWASIAKAEPVSKLNEGFSRVVTGEFDTLPLKKEREEVAEQKFSDGAYTVTSKTYGMKFVLSREAQINDDLGAFTRIKDKMFRVGTRSVEARIAELLHTPGNAFDGNAFYGSAHVNAGTVALSADETGANALAAACKAIRMQKDYDSKQILGLSPRYLVVPIQLEDIAGVLTSSVTVPNASGHSVTNRAQPYALKPVAMAGLGNYDTNNWFVFADPADCESIVVAFLNGFMVPQIFVANTRLALQGDPKYFENACFDTSFEMLYDFGVNKAKWQGSYKSTVAGGTD